jgi:hypothetical protein
MTTNLEVIGPIPIPFVKQHSGSAKHIGNKQMKQFWEDADAKTVVKKQGCYVFALQAAKGFCPWYVGKATKSMKQECLEHHKITHYNTALFQGKKGTPVFFFIVPGENRNKVPKKSIDQMETFLIQSALTKNPQLLNVQKTNIPDWSIKGVIRGGQGKPKANARKFRTAMGLRQ